MEPLRSLVAKLNAINVTVFRLGDTDYTLLMLASGALLFALVIFVSRVLGRLTASRLLDRTHLDLGTRTAIGTLVRYTSFAIGAVVLLQNFGIKLTTFHVLAGAAGVGVGFGLQNIVSNFISGLIVMFERPIKVGDRIELTNVEGTVHEIGMRRTTILTNDNIAIIVPNQRFITDNVVNLAYFDSRIRMRVPVSVAPGSDVLRVRELMLEAARANPDVLGDPPPAVRLLTVGGAAMSLELLVWNRNHVHAKHDLVSALSFAILERLAAAGIKTA